MIGLILPRLREACPRPMFRRRRQTTLMLALGDALAVTVMRTRGVTRAQLEVLRPGGAIGAPLQSVNAVMRDGEAFAARSGRNSGCAMGWRR